MSSVFERLRTLALTKKPDNCEKARVSRSRSMGQAAKRLKYRIDRKLKGGKRYMRPTKKSISKSLRKLSRSSRDNRSWSRVSLKLSPRRQGTCISTVDDWIVDSSSNVLPLYLARRSIRQESIDSRYTSEEEPTIYAPPSALALDFGTPPSFNMSSSDDEVKYEIVPIDETKDTDFDLEEQNKLKNHTSPLSLDDSINSISPAVITMSRAHHSNGGQSLLNIERSSQSPVYLEDYDDDVKDDLISEEDALTVLCENSHRPSIRIIKAASVIKLASLPGCTPSPPVSPRLEFRGLDLGAPDFGSFGGYSSHEHYDFCEDNLSLDEEQSKPFEDLLYSKNDWVQPEDLCPILSMGSLGRGAGGGVSGVFHIPSCNVFALKETTYESEIHTFVILQEALGGRESPQLMSLKGLFQDSNSNEIALVLEYMDLGSLHDFFTSRGGRCTENQIRHIARETLLGLKQLHGLEIPIIHRDIKPHNILIETGGSIRVADYGLLYCLVDENQSCCDRKGTVKYFSPERHSGAFSTPSDIWSLGVTLVECFIGQVINPEDLDAVKVAGGHVNPIDFLDKYEVKMSPLAKNFLRCCLKVDPTERGDARKLLAHRFLQPPYPDASTIFKRHRGERNENLDLLKEILDTIQNYIKAKLQEDSYCDVWANSRLTHEQRLANICRWTGFSKAQVEKHVMYLYDDRTSQRSRAREFK